MMIESIGSLMILSVTTFFGFATANNYERRPKYLREWKYVLNIMETEILHGHASLEDVCFRISTKKTRLSHLFYSLSIELKQERNFPVLWERILEEDETSTFLEEEDVEILRQLGGIIGRYTAEEHKKHFSLAQHYLEEQHQQAVLATMQYKKMARGLGVLSGCLVVLLLI